MSIKVIASNGYEAEIFKSTQIVEITKAGRLVCQGNWDGTNCRVYNCSAPVSEAQYRDIDMAIADEVGDRLGRPFFNTQRERWCMRSF